MTPENFCYWLQGALEIIPKNQELDITQLTIIRDHLSLVFSKVTPNRREPTICNKLSGMLSGMITPTRTEPTYCSPPKLPTIPEIPVHPEINPSAMSGYGKALGSSYTEHSVPDDLRGC